MVTKLKPHDCVKYKKDPGLGWGSVHSVDGGELVADFWTGFRYTVRDKPRFFTKITRK